MFSLVIPVYKNEQSLERLLAALTELNGRMPEEMEVVFVVDGSPDRCFELLSRRLARVPFRSQLVSLSRNFGSFCAIAAGLRAGGGDRFGVLAADLQEPPELILQIADVLLSGRADVVFGCRAGRADPWLSEFFARLFWWIYRRFVLPDMPSGGVDVFGCTRQVGDRLLELKEVNTNLIALLFWLGFRREFVTYRRLPRLEGKSAWTLSKKVRYCFDSLFNFTDLPIKFLLYIGAGGVAVATLLSVFVTAARLSKAITVPGYTPIVLAIMFFGALSSLGLGVLGQYLWLSLQNSRNRPAFIVSSSREYSAESLVEREAVPTQPATGSAPAGGRELRGAGPGAIRPLV
jgi:glycosyltransferase involved in cell wall biosynthesis